MSTQQAMTQPVTVNGLDVQAAFETIDAIKADPGLARFQFRAANTWISGGTNRSTIRDFYGAGREDDSRKEPFEFTNGEPPVLLGDNEGLRVRLPQLRLQLEPLNLGAKEGSEGRREARRG